ncbi:GAF domain-containing protein [Rhodocytophaga aerolata]|uniref:GAF domain-containing protein n=1 Tax=Rhodocytophaga aerolata TaxID=455078 RepID=A0ABT8R2S2_9BACT|nr:GAF domain-containing protein [Rhodocytophaga aerolata]MDO1446400.1 GAF domain-containing protein [Rhodocytophaga aerolata]
MAIQTNTIYQIIEKGKPEPDWNALLTEMLQVYDCTTGTIHLSTPEQDILHLKAYKGIPEFLLPKMSVIPVGKGMAGIAAQRREVVQMCNLQTDESGVARPSAKETKVEGSMAAPMLLNDKLYGTLGVAKPVPYEFTQEEIDTLMQIGQRIAQQFEKN